MSIFRNWFKSGSVPAEKAADPIASQVIQYINGPDHSKKPYWSEDCAKDSDSYRHLMSLESTEQGHALLFALSWLAEDEAKTSSPYNRPSDESAKNRATRFLIATLIRRNLPWDESTFTTLCQGIAGIRFRGYPEPRSFFPAVVARYKKSKGVFTSEQMELLGRICKAWDNESGEAAKWAQKLQALMGTEDAAPPLRVFRNGEIFATRLLDDWEAMDESARNAWAWLLCHAADSSASSPTKKWITRATELLGPVGVDAFSKALIAWLPLIDKPAVEERQQAYPGSNYVRRIHAMEICDPHLDLLKGLVWLVGLLDIDDLTRVIGHVGVSAYKKIPGTGPRATRVGNACVWALGNIGSDSALSQLAMMKIRVKFGSAQIAIGKALETLASKRGVTAEALEEMSVPTYGMTEVGRLEEQFGEYTAVIEVIDDKPVLGFLKPDGNPQKSIPSIVKEQFASDLSDLKGSVKDLEKMLSAQRERLDNLYLLRKTWPFDLWRERYLDHPLVGIMARRLIWSFQAGPDEPAVSAIWHKGALRDAVGAMINPAADAIVHLWHPIESDASEIVRWRNWLFEYLVRQPFKQAHREIYILTDAERNTGTYSNRFASHILKQHQFNGLCAVRGWKNKLRMMVDSEYPPATRLLPAWGLRAEYWIEGVGDDYNDEYVVDSGAYRYIATDQVRFYPIDASQATAHAGGGGYGPRWGGTLGDAMAMEKVPPLVLSEILRDVDLFVGVTSVCNDPAWSDGGPQGRHENYWNRFSFGELGETAEIRKELIASLLPRLKIAKQCHLSGRFLIVKGSLRTYKIHLGSGNILMEPDDRYLCIVKAPAAINGKEVFLPFEGDSKLSVILSKAFLLAADTKIKDSTILSQINATR